MSDSHSLRQCTTRPSPQSPLRSPSLSLLNRIPSGARFISYLFEAAEERANGLFDNMREPTPAEHARLREIWRSMRKRVENPNSKDYKHYHDELRVTICKEWHDFDNFERWAMQSGYRNDLTLDRANNHSGYWPGNCRWISRKQQAYNRSTNTRYYIGGKNYTIEEWSKISGIPAYTICKRIKNGWTPERAIMTPSRVVKKRNGNDKSQSDIERDRDRNLER